MKIKSSTSSLERAMEGKRVIVLIFLFLLFISMLDAQEDSIGTHSTIKVTLVEQGANKPIAFANVILMKEGRQVKMLSTDKNGEVVFENLESGLYDIKGIDNGYTESTLKNVILDAEDELEVTIKLVNSALSYSDLDNRLIKDGATVESKKKGYAILQITANVLTILCYVLGGKK